MQTMTEAIVASNCNESSMWMSIHNSIPGGDKAPLATGLALVPGEMVEAGSLSPFVRDADCVWASLQFCPRGYWRDNADRWIYAIRKTSFCHGVPSVGAGGVLEERILDEPHIMSPRMSVVSNELAWAVLSTGLTCRASWAAHGPAFLQFVENCHLPLRDKFEAWKVQYRDSHDGMEPSQAVKLRHLLFFGGDIALSPDSGVLKTRGWFPTPYLGFQVELRDRLYNAATRVQLQDNWVRIAPPLMANLMASHLTAEGLPVMVPRSGRVTDIHRAVVEDRKSVVVTLTDSTGGRSVVCSERVVLSVSPGDRVCVGDTIGMELIDGLPTDIEHASLPDAVRLLRNNTSRRFHEALVGNWFDRQVLDVIPGYVHLPYAAAATAADISSTDQLLWSVERAQTYFSEASESMILPTFEDYPVGVHKHSFATPLVEQKIELMPVHPDYTSPKTRWWTQAGRRAQRYVNRAKHELRAELGE